MKREQRTVNREQGKTNGSSDFTSPQSPVPSPRLSIIIVNWNGSEHLPDCLGSLEQQTFTDFEVILVDNGSVDDSVAYVQTHHPRVHIVILPENRGFAAGNNIGLDHASGDYIITLNNDTQTDPNWLAELVVVADAHPGAGMVASRICTFTEHDLVDSLGIKICRDGMSRGAFRRQRFSSLSLDRVEEILLPSACVALYRRTMLDEVGFFDEDFFAYCEDTDLGLRGRLAGWGAVLARDAVVYHKYSSSTGTFSPLKLYLVERNHFWAAFKNFPIPLLLSLPFFTLARFLYQARFVLVGGGAGEDFRSSGSTHVLVGALLRGLMAAFFGVPRALAKRRTVMRTRKLPGRELIWLLEKFRMSFEELLDNRKQEP